MSGAMAVSAAPVIVSAAPVIVSSAPVAVQGMQGEGEAMTFVGILGLRGLAPRRALVSARRGPGRAVRPVRLVPSMVQMPDREGPPELEAFFGLRREMIGAPVSVGTGRAVAADPETAVTRAVEKAVASLPDEAVPPVLAHVTFTLDLDPAVVKATLAAALPAGCSVLARTISKKDYAQTVEVMLIAAAACSVDIATVPVTGDRSEAATKAATQVGEAVSLQDGLFAIFVHTPGVETDVVRAALTEMCPGLIAYGGPAVGAVDDGAGWALLADNAMLLDSDADYQSVALSMVPGTISFLQSAIVKNWAQPIFQEPLSFMVANYTGDAGDDLLTAVRYSDWDKFICLIEQENISVNHKWQSKQNQSPLLAACARGRLEMIAYLLEHGADVNHVNDGGGSVYMYTKMLDSAPEIQTKQVALLNQYGANLDMSGPAPPRKF